MAELNSTEFNGLVEFLKIDLTTWGLGVLRYVNTNTFATDNPEANSVLWEAQTWLGYPFESGGYARGGETLVRPGIQIPDFTGQLYVAMRNANFCPGAAVTKYKAFKDDVVAGTPFAAFQSEAYVLAGVAFAGMVMELDLATQIDFAKRKIPGYLMLREDFPGLGSAILRA